MGGQVHFSPKIIGPGKPGFKTQDLVKFASRIEQIDVREGDKRLTLRLPKSTAITPQLCRQFEKEAGCCKDDTPDSAKEKMMNCNSPKFGEAVKEVYRFYYKKNYGWAFATRSDDFGANGVLSTSFVDVNTNLSESSQIAGIRESIMEVLSSAFSEEAKHVARLFAKWSGEGTGILVNPYYGTEFQRSSPQDIIGPAYSLGYLAPLEDSDYAIWQVSHGMAASPEENGRERINTSDPMRSLDRLLGLAQHDKMVGLGEGKGPLLKPVYFSPDFCTADHETRWRMASLLESAMAQIRGALSARNAGSALYTELVCENSRTLYDWVVLQISGMEWMKFVRPEETEFSEKWIQTENAMGFTGRETSGVRFAEYRPDSEMRKYNAEHKGYLLVIDAEVTGHFEKYWKVQDYSNAGAIVVLSSGIMHSVPSHVGGMLRMLDIPMLVFDTGANPDEVEKLIALDKNATLRIVADESVPVGGILKV